MLKKRIERGKGDDRKMDVIHICRHFMVTVSLKCLLMSVFLRGNSSVVSVSDIIIPLDNDYII